MVPELVEGGGSYEKAIFESNLVSTEAQINRYLREESPRLLSLSKQEDFGDFSKFKISENLCFSTYQLRCAKEIEAMD